MFYQFWIPFLLIGMAVVFCDRKWCMLRALSAPKPQPYSWSRVQLGWWTVIVMSSFIAIMWVDPAHHAPTLNASAVILLGISSLTTVTARSLDANSSSATDPEVHAMGAGTDGFFLDILSDSSGVSISRFQTVIFNLVFGIWYVYALLQNLGTVASSGLAGQGDKFPFPLIDNNNLILLGLSSATYAVMKVTENKEKENKAAATDNAAAPAAAEAAGVDNDPEPAVG